MSYTIYVLYCTVHYYRQMPQELWADDSVVWSRDYSSPDSVEVTPATVTKLEEVRYRRTPTTATPAIVTPAIAMPCVQWLSVPWVKI
jgi:hypothetical protein